MEQDAFGFAEQAKWETEGTRRAVVAYRESMERAAKAGSLKALPGSQRIMREVVPPLAAAIKEQQLKAAGAAGGAKWAWPVRMLSEEKLAVITLIHALRCQLHVDSEGGAMLGLALAIASTVRDEVEFGEWTKQQRAANKEAEDDPDHVDLLAKLKAQHPDVDRRTWAKWRSQVGILRTEPWSKHVSAALGGHLLGLLLEVAPKHFERIEVPTSAGRQSAYALRLTPETYEMMRDLKTRAEVARPALLPMVIPPLPWRYEGLPA